MSDQKTIDIRKLIASKNPKLLKWLPGFVVRYLERILHQDEINDFLNSIPDAKDEDFCDETMKFINFKVQVKGIENLPPTGKITIAMNHPLGGMDAIALVSALREKRSDLKFIVNDLLLNLNKMNGLFLGINKHGKKPQNKRTQINELFSSENAVCIFPAGLVSRKIDGKVMDLEWKKTFVSQSVLYERTIVPIYLEGNLSNWFYRLSNFRKRLGIKANVEMLYLSDELFKLRGSKMTMHIGKPIHHTLFTKEKTDLEWAKWIKDKVYSM
ncbi:MAG: putative hemolysin [Lentimonas sp.]|jgi:putative hemolysin